MFPTSPKCPRKSFTIFSDVQTFPKSPKSPRKSINTFSDVLTFPHISESTTQDSKESLRSLLEGKCPFSREIHSMNKIKFEKRKSLSPKKLPPLASKSNLEDSLQQIRPFLQNEEKTSLEKLDNHSELLKIENSPEFIKKEQSLKNAKRISIVCTINRKNSLFNSGVLTENAQELSLIQSPMLPSERKLEVSALQKLWKFFSTPVFQYVNIDFMERIKNDPQLAPHFQSKDLEKICNGKLEFFERNVGKRDMNMHNRFFLETIHKKMNISHEEFNLFKGYYAIAMRARMIDEDLIADFLIFLENFRKNIVSETPVFQRAYVNIPDFGTNLTEFFREKILNNKVVSPFFQGRDNAFHSKHCLAIVNLLLNGKKGDFDRNLRKSHQNCPMITDHVFYNFKQCLLQGLKEFQVGHALDTNKFTCPFAANRGGKDPYLSANDLFEIGDLLETTRSTVMNQRSFYEILTEKFKFEEIVNWFLRVSSQKPLTNALFQKYSPERMKRHTELMLTYLLGGPTKYIKSDLTPAHYNMEISMELFDETRKALEETLMNFNVETKDITHILALLDGSKYDICKEKPLLVRMGGTKTLDYVVNHFYLKIIKHPSLNEYFKNKDLKKTITNQKFWFTKFFENTNIKPYHFKDLRSYHMGLETKEAFNYFEESLIEGLRDFGHIGEEVIKEALAWFRRCQNDILSSENK